MLYASLDNEALESYYQEPYLCVILQNMLVQAVIALLNVKMKYQVKT